MRIIIIISLQVVLLSHCISETKRTSYSSDVYSIKLEMEILDTTQIDLSSISNKISIVPLEESEDSLIGNIHSVVDGYWKCRDNN